MRRFAGAWGTTISFAVASALVLTGLFVAVTGILDDGIEERAVANAELVGRVVASVAVPDLFTIADLRVGLGSARVERLSELLAERFADTPVTRVRVFNEGGEVIFADDLADLRTDGLAVPGVGQALQGELVSGVRLGADGEPELVVHVPDVRDLGRGPQVVAVHEVHLPYGDTQAAIDADVARLRLTLGGGLLVVWLVLLRLALVRLRDDARNRWLAHHDSLTSLPNRVDFERRVDELMQRDPHREHGGMAVLLLDLDRFKDVNDTFGHHVGDKLLVEVAARWSAVLRDGDVVARLGGDEFAVRVASVDRQAPEQVAQRLLDALEAPIVIGELELDVDASAGIAVSPEDGSDFDELMRHADAAMYRAKLARSSIARFDPGLDTGSNGRLLLLGDLRRALVSGELHLHHQPRVDLRSGEIVGVEALVRWEHPQRGLLAPNEFVPLAEQSGMAPDVTAVVVTSALAALRTFREHRPDLVASVNLSTRDLVDDEVVRVVESALAAAGLPGEALELEITETAAMVDPERSHRTLDRLAALGVRLAVDDFGTGHATLSYLASLPVDVLKIDRSFVMAVDDPANRAIVESTIDLGHRLGLHVVAEGVETAEAWALLQQVGCETAQGDWLSPAVPLAEALTAMDAIEQRLGHAASSVADRTPA